MFRNNVVIKLSNLTFTITTSILPLLAACLVSGCKGADGGFAPSAVVSAPASSSKIQATLFKMGSLAQVNGWNLQVDMTDSVKNVVTTNGWKIEVKYE